MELIGYLSYFNFAINFLQNNFDTEHKKAGHTSHHGYSSLFKKTMVLCVLNFKETTEYFFSKMILSKTSVKELGKNCI